MNNFEEIIQFAIRHEEEEAAFYQQMAQRADSADMKEALLVHAREEMLHKEHLEKIQANNRLPNGERRYPDCDLQIADYTTVEDRGTGTLTFEKALLLAAKREKTAQRLYQDLANQATDPDLKKTLLFLADQEGKHGQRLEREYDDSLTEG
ncbi:MAG: ferritin family protein [Magnetococcus sp. DMHC-6]